MHNSFEFSSRVLPEHTEYPNSENLLERFELPNCTGMSYVAACPLFVYIESQAGTWTFRVNDVMQIMLGGPSFDIIENIHVKYER